VSDYGAGGHKAILAQRYATDNGRIGADGSPSFHKGSPILVFAFDVTAGIYHICEDHGRPTEDVILKLHTGIYRDVILDLYSVADYDCWADHDVLPEITVTPDPGTGHYMAEMPYLTAGTNFTATLDNCSWISEILQWSFM
jgi:hypothetical protein